MSQRLPAHCCQRDSFAPLPDVTEAWVRGQIIGREATAQTPFGERRIVYADHVASGQALRWIENFVLEQVLPWYANTHTEDSATGARTTSLVRDAANHIKACMGAQGCKLLFCGTGSTAAIKRLQEILCITVPDGLRAQVLDSLEPRQRPIVLVGPYEHHSNEISWRETIAEVIELPLDSEGALDLDALRAALDKARENGRPVLGSFSAASNVTGAITDTRAVARLLHAHGALAFFDFAAAAPHVEIDMRTGQADGYDAVFISGHKLTGGPGTPGLLVFDPALYRLRVPSSVGGGTVRYVTSHEHHFVDDIETREDAGTPGAVQRIRLALAFLVKESIGVQTIARLEGEMVQSAIARLRAHPRIWLLGNLEAPRLAILSFLVRSEDGRCLHPRLVSRLLNDLFGIQSRAGCACAAPYAHQLLGIGPTQVQAYCDAVLAGFDAVKPGWTRLSFSYFIETAELEFLLDAIEFIAEHGERFVGEYTCDWGTGAWHHRDEVPVPELLALAWRPGAPCQPPLMTYRECIACAHAIAAAVPASRASSSERKPGSLPDSLVSFTY